MGWQAQSWWQLQSGGWWLLQHRGTLLAAKTGGGSVWDARRVYDASSSGGSQLYLSSIIQGWRGDEDVRVVRVSELSDTRLPHASPEWPQQRVGSCAAQYLLSTYLHIYTLGAELRASVDNILWITAEICHIKQWHSHLKCLQFRQTHWVV